MQDKRSNLFFLVLILLTILLFITDILLGPVKISIADFFNTTSPSNTISSILFELRLTKAITAIAAGAGLSISGLLLQTLFKNPLAGPYTLGVTSGASLGAAIAFMSGFYFSNTYLQTISVFALSGIGSFGVLLLIAFISSRIKNIVIILIVGLLLGHLLGALESLLQFFSRPEQLQSFAIWGMGSFSQTSLSQSIWMLLIIIILFFSSLFFSKPLNSLLLGHEKALLIGTNTKKVQNLIIAIAGIIATLITALCGPIAFIGFIAPHIARWLFKTYNHKTLLHASFFIGCVLALFCDIISQNLFSSLLIPVNIIASIIGAPIIIWIIVKRISI
ncbi:MAG: iron ABC transporter permease [Bacteroidetes bacterium]|nr:iron ABC transporter permease [Bacteroidota bacterium]